MAIWLAFLIRCRQSHRDGDEQQRNGYDPTSANACHLPTPFLARLARHLDCDEADLAKLRDRPESRMTFWTNVSFDSRCDPKSASLIQRILERLGQHVHGP